MLMFRYNGDEEKYPEVQLVSNIYQALGDISKFTRGTILPNLFFTSKKALSNLIKAYK